MTPLPGHVLGRDLFERLRAASLDVPGVTRASFGPGECATHVIVAQAARELGREVAADAIGTLHMRLAGSDRPLPAVTMGSHFDSVPHGGNFDGRPGSCSALPSPRPLVPTPEDGPAGGRVIRAQITDERGAPVASVVLADRTVRAA